jgi:hypothetical protein
MEKLPSQLAWRDFERVLRELGYQLHKAGTGAARTYLNLGREPNLITFHEPHSPNTLAKGTLREYIRRLQLSRDEFMELLK